MVSERTVLKNTMFLNVSNLPQASGNLPEVSGNLPEVSGNFLDASGNFPEMSGNFPVASLRLPDLAEPDVKRPRLVPRTRQLNPCRPGAQVPTGPSWQPARPVSGMSGRLQKRHLGKGSDILGCQLTGSSPPRRGAGTPFPRNLGRRSATPPCHDALSPESGETFCNPDLS